MQALRGTLSSSKSGVPRWVADLLVALGLAVAAYVPFGDPSGPGAYGTRALPLLLIAAATLPARRRFPVAVLAATVLVATVANAVGIDTPVFVLPVAVAVWSLTSGDRRTAIILTAATAVVMPLTCVVGLPLDQWPRILLGPQAMQLAAIIGFACAGGLAVESRRATLRAYEDRAERAERTRDAEARRRVAEERLAIARDLHDSVAHRMAVINLHSGLAARTLRNDPDRAESSLAVVEEAARTVLGEIGELLSALRDPGAAGGLPAAGGTTPETVVAAFRASGLVVDAVLEDCSGLPAAVGEVITRVVQEALTNVVKHGGGGRVLLVLSRSPLAVTVRVDNAVGARAGRGWGQGLLGASERVRAAGGTFRADRHGSRFLLEAIVPITVRVGGAA